MTNNNDESSKKQNVSNLNDKFSSVSLSDKLWLFYKKYGKQLTIIAIIMLSLTAIVPAYLLHTSALENKIAKDFQVLDTINSKIEFVKKYPRETLAGAMSLELADLNFESEKFSEASEFYKTALKSQLPEELNCRAKIYLACCLDKLNKQPEAMKILQAIIDNMKISSANRAFAEFILINMTIEHGDPAKAANLAKLATEKDYSTMWNNLFGKITAK